jgi:hypothetical protein
MVRSGQSASSFGVRDTSLRSTIFVHQIALKSKRSFGTACGTSPRALWQRLGDAVQRFESPARRCRENRSYSRPAPRPPPDRGSRCRTCERTRAYPPRSACGSTALSVSTAVVTKTRSFQTIGEKTPRPGIATFQRTCVFSSHRSGGTASGEPPVASGPRQTGQAANEHASCKSPRPPDARRGAPR